MAPRIEPDAGAKSNMEVDYVVIFEYGTEDLANATKQFEKLTQALEGVGLDTSVRAGDDHTLLLFVKAYSDEHLFAEVYRSRIRDFLHRVRGEAPAQEATKELEKDPLTEAERLRIVYQLITNSVEEGGAGILPGKGQWTKVKSITALHNPEFNKQWIKRLSSKYILDDEQLDEVRDVFGAKVALYFAFIQTYFKFLVYLAAFGAASWYLLGPFSPMFAIANGLWCIIFTEYWKHQEVDYAIRWGTTGTSKLAVKRPDFEYTKEISDPVTGEKVKYFSHWQRFLRQLLQVPFAVIVVGTLGTLITTCFSIDVFMSEVYDGPLQSILTFTPTVLLTVFMPVLSTVLTTVAERLVKFENYETDIAYHSALTLKLFIMDLVTSYLGAFLTAFVYVPFGTILVPYLQIYAPTVRLLARNEDQLKPAADFKLNSNRLRNQIIYYVVTAQIVNFAMELVVPYVKRWALAKYKEYKNERAITHGGATQSAADNDPPEETQFLQRVRKEIELDDYDAMTDVREMVIQFGYLSLFSVIWPLTATSFLVNNWFEIRADAMKIAVEKRRPIPQRTDTIGPWLDSLSFLAWLGSITTSALVYMFSCGDGVGVDGTPHAIKAWALLLTIFFSEQLYLAARGAVRVAIEKIDTPGRQAERRHIYLRRKAYIDENSSTISKAVPKIEAAPEEFDRQTLEEEARKASLRDTTPEDRFWYRQRGWKASAKVGEILIERSVPEFEVESKKEL